VGKRKREREATKGPPGHTQAKPQKGPNKAAPIPTKIIKGIKRHVPTEQEIIRRAGPIRPASLMRLWSCSGLRCAPIDENPTSPIEIPARISRTNALISVLRRALLVILIGSSIPIHHLHHTGVTAGNCSEYPFPKGDLFNSAYHSGRLH
jgi:hypothetical protein